MTTTINHKHERTYSFRISKKAARELAEAINSIHDVTVTFYGRFEWDATGKSYVLIAERDELHAFKTQTDAYFYMSDLEWELTQAEQAAEAEATKPETIETTITQEQANELHTLRLEKALSWYELAQRYGITDDEARRVYNAIHTGKAVSTIATTTTVDADGEVADEGTTVDERGEIVESDEQAIDLSHMNTAAWQVACACCLVGTGCVTNHFAFNYLFRDDFDVALAENVREARGMVAECIDRADEFRIEGEELDALADELRMLDAWLDANEATIITVSGEGYELTAYETEDGWQALGRIGDYDVDTVWCDCHGLSFDDLDSVILHVFESERRDRMMLAG